MAEQREITAAGPLLDEKGELRLPGYSKRMVQQYRRADVKGGPLRLKEWDYYCVNNGRFALALTVADNSYMGLDSISLLNLEEGWEVTKSPMQFMTRGKKALPESSARGDVHSAGKGYSLHFLHLGSRRTLIAQMADFGPAGPLAARVELTEEPEESMVIATPFPKRGHFYYNQKINCLRASGYVTYDGRTYAFDPADSFAVLDWGRGVWTYKNTWYWSSASGVTETGEVFGFNLGYGFGDTSAASENMLFCNGLAHKLGQVRFLIPGEAEGKPRFTEPWRVTDEEGRLALDFVPALDRKSCTDIKLIKSDQHQVFGRFTGRAVLDDGREIQLKDFPGFAEKVCNKW